MIELRDVRKGYELGGQRVHALDGVDLRLEPGTITAVVGPSGAGKSTLLHVAGGLDTVDSGTVDCGDLRVSDLDDDALARYRLDKVGMVFQAFNLLPSLTAWENVALPALLGTGDLASARSRAEELLGLVGLASRAEHRPDQLSGGQMQRVAVARALTMGPVLLLADEPTGNLDSETGEAILDLLVGLAHEPTERSVLVVTHDASVAAECDRVVTLRDGCVVDDTAVVGG